jgi:hypothetical protein
MAAIREQDIAAVYALGVKVWRGEMSKRGAVRELEAQGMSAGSANMYICCVLGMLKGERYVQVVNMKATRYFLERIKSDFGADGLRLLRNWLEV